MRQRPRHLRSITAVMSLIPKRRSAGGDDGLDVTGIPVIALLEEVAGLAESVALAEGVCLVMDLHRMPVTAHVDRTVLLRVLANIADQTIRATPRGGHVALSAATSGDAVDLRVTTGGRGIAVGRLMLGLTAARDLTRRMGGDLLVESAAGVGSRVTVRLPVQSRRRSR